MPVEPLKFLDHVRIDRPGQPGHGEEGWIWEMYWFKIVVEVCVGYSGEDSTEGPGYVYYDVFERDHLKLISRADHAG